jgi:protein-tyrosine phosphatase
LDGAINFRDLGGYRTRDGRVIAQGRLYRSDTLWNLTDADLDTLATLRLRTLCDLRGTIERDERPNRLPTPAPRVHAIGFRPHGADETFTAISRGEAGAAEAAAMMHDHYEAFVDRHADHFVRMFQALLEPDALPALIHCASGKDRTGFGIAMILLAVGVDREQVMADYRVSDRHRRDLAYLFNRPVAAEIYEALATAHPDYLRRSLARIDAGWGGEDAYLREVMRLGPAEREHLRALLLEPA